MVTSQGNKVYSELMPAPSLFSPFSLDVQACMGRPAQHCYPSPQAAHLLEPIDMPVTDCVS